MRTKFLLAVCLLPAVAFGQINRALKHELDSIFVVDQHYRNYFSEIHTNQKLADSLKTALHCQDNLEFVLSDAMHRVDSLNMLRVVEIIKRYGYPGRSLVGETTNEAVYYVIQHSPSIATYFPLTKRAGRANELPRSLVATMQDRLLTEQLKPQLYGTQAECYPVKDGSNAPECFVWPIKRPNRVNARRRKAGFIQSVEENAKRMDAQYEILTINQMKKRYDLGN